MPRARSGTNWYTVLKDWDDSVEAVGNLDIGTVDYGQYRLVETDYDHDVIMAGLVSGIAPRRVKFDLRFLEEDEATGAEADTGAVTTPASTPTQTFGVFPP